MPKKPKTKPKGNSNDQSATSKITQAVGGSFDRLKGKVRTSPTPDDEEEKVLFSKQCPTDQKQKTRPVKGVIVWISRIAVALDPKVAVKDGIKAQADEVTAKDDGITYANPGGHDLLGQIETLVKSDLEKIGQINTLLNSDLEKKGQINTLLTSDSKQKGQIETLLTSDLEKKGQINTLLKSDLEETGQIKSLQTQMQDKTAEQESVNLALERNVANLRVSSKKFKDIKARQIAYCERDVKGRGTDRGTGAIQTGNRLAHEGCAVEDAKLFKDDHHLNRATFRELYGMDYKDVLSYDEEVNGRILIRILEDHATLLLQGSTLGDPLDAAFESVLSALDTFGLECFNSEQTSIGARRAFRQEKESREAQLRIEWIQQEYEERQHQAYVARLPDQDRQRKP